jgi:primosomal protein N'
MEYEMYKKIALISHITKTNLIIQTRDIENPFWKHLEKNDIDAIKNTKELETLNLPPFATHIQISIPTEKSKKTLETVKGHLERQEQFFEITDKLKTTLHILADKKEYLRNPLIYYLKSLPHYIQVEVDSRNLL